MLLLRLFRWTRRVDDCESQVAKLARRLMHLPTLLFCSAHYLIDTITKTEEWARAISKLEAEQNTEAVEFFKEAMRKGSMNLDKTMRELPSVKSNEDHSGTTAVYGLVTPTHIIVGNIGDSRSILVRGGSTVAMSFDHKPTNVRNQPPHTAHLFVAYLDVLCDYP